MADTAVEFRIPEVGDQCCHARCHGWVSLRYCGKDYCWDHWEKMCREKDLSEAACLTVEYATIPAVTEFLLPDEKTPPALFFCKCARRTTPFDKTHVLSTGWYWYVKGDGDPHGPFTTKRDTKQNEMKKQHGSQS